jgi:hypothetical protein
MPIQTKPTLKTYFETGDKPTESNFVDLIDTLCDDTVYSSAWNGVTDVAPSKNALYGKIEALATSLIGLTINNTIANYGLGINLVSNTGGDCIAFGTGALNGNTGNINVAFLTNAGLNNTGSNCVMAGNAAGYGNTGNYLNAFGTEAGKNNTGVNNNFFGVGSGYGNTGSNISAFGQDTAHGNTGSNNFFGGFAAGRDSTGSEVVALGTYSGRLNTYSNIFTVSKIADVYLNGTRSFDALGLSPNTVTIQTAIADNVADRSTALSVLKLAQARATGNADAGSVIFQKSVRGSSGTTLQTLSDTIFFEGNTGNWGFFGNSFGSGEGVTFFGNATTAPTSNPTGGALLYAESGILKVRDTNGLGILATQAYANSLVVGLWDDRGNYDASGNAFPSSGGSGTSGAIRKGDIWTVSVIGTLGGVAVALGDTVRALVDTPGSTSANWALAEHDLGYTPVTNTRQLTINGTTFDLTTDRSWSVGTVTSVGIATANGISGSTAITGSGNLTITLGAITPSSVNGLTLTSQSVGFTVAGGTTSKTLTVPLDATVSGTNTGDQTVFGRTGNIVAAANDYTFAQLASIPTTVAGYGITDVYTKTAGDARYLQLSGGTLTGSLVLNSDATTGLQAVTYQQLVATVAGMFELQQGFDASTNLFPVASQTNPVVAAIKKGFVWNITVAGTLGGTPVQPGDIVTALIDNPGTTAANWLITEHDFGFTPVSNVLNSANIFVGNASNVAAGVAMTGDISVTNAGVTAIGASKVTNAMLAGSIAASKLVGTDIATVGTITAGTWNGSLVIGTYGGTGVNNGTKTITLGGNLATTGAFNLTLAVPQTTTYTLPNTANETLAGLGTAQTFTATQSHAAAIQPTAANTYDLGQNASTGDWRRLYTRTIQPADVTTANTVGTTLAINSGLGNGATISFMTFGTAVSASSGVQQTLSIRMQLGDQGTPGNGRNALYLHGTSPTSTNYTFLSLGSSGATVINCGSASVIDLRSNDVQALRTSTASPIITGASASAVFRLTNGGGDVTAHGMIDPAGTISTAGSLAYAFDTTNGFSFTHANGTRRIRSWSAKLTNLVNTAGSESSDITWTPQNVTDNFIIGGGLNLNQLTGTTSRMVEIDSNGNVSASEDILSLFISDSTIQTQLRTLSNWNSLGVYTGSAISGATQGQHDVDGQNLYLLEDNTTPVKINIVPTTVFVQTADSTVGNTTTETSLLGTLTGSKTLPANFFKAGKSLDFVVQGYITNTGTPTLQIRLRIGGVAGTLILDSGAFTMNTIIGTQRFVFRGRITCRTTGASGSVIAQGALEYYTGSSAPNSISMITTGGAITLDTTAAKDIELTAAWGTANASDTMTITNADLNQFIPN